MDDGQLFRETFSGVLTGEYNLAQTKTRFGKLFKVSPAKVSRLFTGKETILNNNVAEEVAMKFAIRLAEAGCESVIEKISGFDHTQGTSQFQDRRAGESRIRFRRAPRKDALIPDRKLLVGRRKQDQVTPTQKLAS